jgi:hypothetical protein
MKLLLKLFILCGFISIFIIYTEIKLREFPNSYSVKRNNLEKNLDSIQILILGSSQSLDGINPSFFDLKGFNLANSVQSLYYDKELTLKYVDKMPNLKIIFISISDFSLWLEIYNSVDSWRDYFYYNFWNIKPNNTKIFDLKQICYIDLYGISFSQNAFRKNFKVELEELPTENGWFFQKKQLSFPLTDSSGLARIWVHKQMIRDNVYNNNAGYLESLLSEITKRNIIPILITTPVHKTYYQNADTKKLNNMEELLNKMSSKFHCKYFNYFKDTRFDRIDFADADHLSNNGAIKFSKIINNEIISPVINQKK